MNLSVDFVLCFGYDGGIAKMDRWCSWPVSPGRKATERTRRINTPAIMRSVVYVLLSKKDFRTYVGSTDNIDRRLDEHNDGRVASTKHRRPLILIYQEAFDTLMCARRKEIFYKSSYGRRCLRKIIEPIRRVLKEQNGSVV